MLHQLITRLEYRNVRAMRQQIVTLAEVGEILYEDAERAPEAATLRAEEYARWRATLQQLPAFQEEVLYLASPAAGGARKSRSRWVNARAPCGCCSRGRSTACAPSTHSNRKEGHDD